MQSPRRVVVEVGLGVVGLADGVVVDGGTGVVDGNTEVGDDDGDESALDELLVHADKPSASTTVPAATPAVVRRDHPCGAMNRMGPR